MQRRKEIFTMAKQQKQEPVNAITEVPEIDTFLFVIKLHGLIEESRDIAQYIDANVQYGRALGYAEGKHAAYRDIAKRLFDGEFEVEAITGEDGYEL
jgi:DNA-binding helix-hairpin-helix protein with protein kinase domain